MKFDPNKRLPEALVIKSKGNHLYKIGLSLFSNEMFVKDRILNPIFVFINVILLIIRSIVVILIPQEYEHLMPFIGDIFIGMKVKIPGNLIMITVGSFAIFSQLLHYYEYKKNLKPTYLKVFDVISGKIPPISIGLTNEFHIHLMVRRFKYLLRLCELSCNAIGPVVVIAYVYGFASVNDNFWHYSYLYVFYSIHAAIALGYCTNAINVWQVFYFYTFSYYLKIKLRSNTNLLLLKLKHSKNQLYLRNVMNRFDSIYTEISEANAKYFSKWLFIFWLIISTFICVLLYPAFYGDMNFGHL